MYWNYLMYVVFNWLGVFVCEFVYLYEYCMCHCQSLFYVSQSMNDVMMDRYKSSQIECQLCTLPINAIV